MQLVIGQLKLSCESLVILVSVANCSRQSCDAYTIHPVLAKRRDTNGSRPLLLLKTARLTEQESPADAVKPARSKSMQKLLHFDVFRFISPNSISPNFKV